MKRKHLWKKGTALLLTLGMLSTSVPVTTFAEEAAGDGDVASDSIVATALANYDFNDFTVSEDGNSLTDGTRTVTLEAEGNGKKPEIISSGRGKVLKLTEQSYADRADGKSICRTIRGEWIYGELLDTYYRNSRRWKMSVGF